MRIKILLVNHLKDSDPQTIEGSYQQVEEILRGLFHEETQGVPEGDLLTVLQEVAHSYGVEVSVLDGIMPQPQPHLHPEVVRR